MKNVFVLILVLLVAASASAQTNNLTFTNNAGEVYSNFSVVKIESDGVLFRFGDWQYERVKFTNMPTALWPTFGYDPEKARLAAEIAIQEARLAETKPAQHDFRLFGTNLFDFTPLMSDPSAMSFQIEGKVTHIYPYSIRITYSAGVQLVYVPPSWETIQNASPSDMLSQLYATQVAERGVSLGEVMAMSPELRQNFQPVEKFADVYLLNYPFQTTVGSSIDCFALPTATRGFWDYGKSFSGDPSTFKVIYRVRPTGIVKEYSPEEKKAMKQASDAKAVAWLISQATNGSASAQCSLGLRYLNGEGVETNKVLAIEWLKKAANQGDIEASNKLLKLSVIQTNR